MILPWVLQVARFEPVVDTFAWLFDNYFDYNSEASSNHSGGSQQDQAAFKKSLIDVYGEEQNGKFSCGEASFDTSAHCSNYSGPNCILIFNHSCL